MWLGKRKYLYIYFPSIFRLDLVPINRSVGLKAKPTKPVTEVLRPVVAKYGLHLNDLVAKIVSLAGSLQGFLFAAVYLTHPISSVEHDSDTGWSVIGL
jgi:hypothetical protein